MHMEFETISDNGVGQDANWRVTGPLSGLLTPATGGITHYKWNYDLCNF